jgi:cytochrome c biogenesis protein CcmG, thiol:disulfide interchange protein DsbE
MKLKSNLLAASLRAAALCLVSVTAPLAWSLEAGTAAPDLNLPGLKEAVSLAGLKGKVVYVDFWASWCGPCKQSFPFMNELQSKYRAEGFEIVAVNLDAKRDDADKFLAEVPARFTVAFDAKGESAKRFDVKGMPSSYLIGRDGKVVALHKGFKDEDRKALDAGIAQALAAK